VSLGYHEGSGSLFKANFKNSLTDFCKEKLLKTYKSYFYWGIILSPLYRNFVLKIKAFEI
jgi:hypothetical protein